MTTADFVDLTSDSQLKKRILKAAPADADKPKKGSEVHGTIIIH
jgi:hypothetical protein